MKQDRQRTRGFMTRKRATEVLADQSVNTTEFMHGRAIGYHDLEAVGPLAPGSSSTLHLERGRGRELDHEVGKQNDKKVLTPTTVTGSECTLAVFTLTR
jgi:hypothetical protein